LRRNAACGIVKTNFKDPQLEPAEPALHLSTRSTIEPPSTGLLGIATTSTRGLFHASQETATTPGNPTAHPASAFSRHRPNIDSSPLHNLHSRARFRCCLRRPVPYLSRNHQHPSRPSTATLMIAGPVLCTP
jgi:hypothetical protein